MLNYNHLFYFHVAASEGSLAKAAERLGVTQPTVSEQVRLLEKELGVRLFERSTTGLRLTEHGRNAYEHTTPMFRAGERLVETITPQQGPTSNGHAVRVGVSTAVVHRVACDLLTPLFVGPGAAASVRTSPGADLVRAVAHHEVDLALCEFEPVGAGADGLRSVELHRPRLVAVVGANTTVREGWVDLGLLDYPPGSAQRHEIADYLRDHALTPRHAGDCDDPALMIEIVKRTPTVAFVPRTFARGEIARGELRALALLPPSGAGVHAVSRDGQLALMSLERLVTYARDVLDA